MRWFGFTKHQRTLNTIRDLERRAEEYMREINSLNRLLNAIEEKRELHLGFMSGEYYGELEAAITLDFKKYPDLIPILRRDIQNRINEREAQIDEIFAAFKNRD